MGKCKVCGKPTLGNYEYCLNCKPKDRNPRQGGYRGQQGPPRGRNSIPDKCIFRDSFYCPDGYLKREVNIEAAEEMAWLLQNDGMTQTSLRQLFNLLKSVELRLKTDRNLPLGFIRENFDKFITHTEYQTKRGVIKETFRGFVQAHKDIAVKSKEEFKGFVQYMTAIVARMKQK